VMAARPFAERITAAAQDLALMSEGLGEATHPLLVTRPESKKGGVVELLAITSDRGLCGAFNSNVARRAMRTRFDLGPVHKEIRVSTVGRKASEAMKRDGVAVRKHYTGTFEALSYANAKAIADEITAMYIKGEIDAFHLVYNEFVNAGTQRVVVNQLLPIEAPHSKPEAPSAQKVDFEYEPSRKKLLDELLPREIATKIYRALLESVAAEHAARMQAMENASKNAKEMVSSLTLYYNRARQAAITKELMEIIGGAEALK
jgi:F-type H+-transporting ATPase subunit gamma